MFPVHQRRSPPVLLLAARKRKGSALDSPSTHPTPLVLPLIRHSLPDSHFVSVSCFRNTFTQSPLMRFRYQELDSRSTQSHTHCPNALSLYSLCASRRRCRRRLTAIRGSVVSLTARISRSSATLPGNLKRFYVVEKVVDGKGVQSEGQQSQSDLVTDLLHIN